MWSTSWFLSRKLRFAVCAFECWDLLNNYFIFVATYLFEMEESIMVLIMLWPHFHTSPCPWKHDIPSNNMLKHFFLLPQCFDLGYIRLLRRNLLAKQSAEQQMHKMKSDELQRMEMAIRNMHGSSDKEMFIDANKSAFYLPKLFDFHPHPGDQVRIASGWPVWCTNPFHCQKECLQYAKLCDFLTLETK